MLIAAGADIRHTDSMGDSLLHVAANVNDAKRALQLLQAGLDPLQANQRGTTFQAALFAGSDSRLNAEGKRSEEHTSELQSLMRISYAVFCLKKKKKTHLVA